MNSGLFGIATGVVNAKTPVQINLVLAAMHVFFDLGRDLPPDDGPDISHQSFGFPHLARGIACVTMRNVSCTRSSKS